MKKKTETETDGKEFERFDEFLRQVVHVPKEKIDEREKEYKKKKGAKKKG